MDYVEINVIYILMYTSWHSTDKRFADVSESQVDVLKELKLDNRNVGCHDFR